MRNALRPNMVGRPSLEHVPGSGPWLMKKYSLTYNQIKNNRAVLIRLELMKPEGRQYMLKLIREQRY